MGTGAEAAGSMPMQRVMDESRRLDAIRRWLGLGVALLLLALASYVSLQYRAQKQALDRASMELLMAGLSQAQAGDYAGAWTQVRRAAHALDAQGALLWLTGGLSAQQARVGATQQDLAMRWLRAEADRVPGGHSSSEVTDQVLAVLSNAASQADGERRADLLAHIGWAYELKALEGTPGLKVESFYRDALAADPANPYASTFWAIPVVEQTSASEEGIAQARQRYTAALSSGRARGALRQWIRAHELSGVRRWLSYPAAGVFFWQTVEAMYRAGEPFDGAALEDLRSEYLGTQINVAAFSANLDRLLAYLPAVNHVDLLTLLLPAEPGPQRGYVQACLALALEKAGRPQAALAAWRAAKAAAGEQLGRALDEAIARLAVVGGGRG
jgi:hypothetical protein